jgi:hypothetical protein
MNRKFASLYIALGLALGMGTALAQVPNPPTELSVEGGSSVPSAPSNPGRALFFDDFEYDISRSSTNTISILQQNGWAHAKSENSAERSGSGYLYTRADGTRGSRVLVMESRPSMNPPPGDFPNQQTDYYVQYGREGGSSVPANIWIQFWTYATPESRFATRDKTIYPCRGSYPCHPTWLFMWGAQGFQDSRAPADGRFLALEAQAADRDTRTSDGNEAKLFQNVNGTPLLAGRWYQVRLHMDVSGTQGVYEAWIKERGQSSFTKVADWRGGSTANFRWPLNSTDRTPFTMLRAPTTVNGPGDSTTYIDDFAIATSQDNLPQ